MAFTFTFSCPGFLNTRRRVLASACVAALAVCDTSGHEAAAEPPEKLSPVVVTEAPSIAEARQLPQVTESVTATQIATTINVVDPEDALRYFPSLFVRKRNYGDTQPVLASRVWGVSSSARSLVYGDGILLTALIANNNNIGAPRWGLIAPAEIERMDVMYGPFAAAYPGNSMGVVLEITTRQPEKFESSLDQTLAWQDFAQYGTHRTFFSSQSAATVGDRAGKFSYWVSVNFQDSHSQPLGYATNATFPAGTTSGYPANNKLGQPADVVGAVGLLHTRMTNAKLKLAYDLTPWLRASYTLGAWRNDGDSSVATYLANTAGAPTFAGLAAFATNTYSIIEEHSAHSLVLRSETRGAFDFEASASLYRLDRDDQRSPVAASALNAPPGFGAAGKLAVLGGGWNTLDLKGTWRPGEKAGTHVVTFGAHDDRYQLYNPTFNTAEWTAGAPTSVAAEGDGQTRTQALWAQDVWTPAPTLKLTLGARTESWRAYDGYNVNGAATVHQPDLKRRNTSPKATLAWTVSPQWTATLSVGQAYRYATAAELYQLVTTGTTFTAPNPNLKPDDVLATELRLERKLEAGRVRLSLFQDEVHDAIIAQFEPLVPGSTQLFSFASNVDRVRARGAELVVEKSHFLFSALDVSASATWLDARTLATQGQGQFGSAIGKRLPNIPDWRATFLATYHASPRWDFTLAGRYSGMLFTTLDDADTNPNTYQGFSAWFVADARVHYHATRHWSASLGADNLVDRKYFVFHPFPQRTVVADVKYEF